MLIALIAALMVLAVTIALWVLQRLIDADQKLTEIVAEELEPDLLTHDFTPLSGVIGGNWDAWQAYPRLGARHANTDHVATETFPTVGQLPKDVER